MWYKWMKNEWLWDVKGMEYLYITKCLYFVCGIREICLRVILKDINLNEFKM